MVCLCVGRRGLGGECSVFLVLWRSSVYTSSVEHLHICCFSLPLCDCRSWRAAVLKSMLSIHVCRAVGCQVHPASAGHDSDSGEGGGRSDTEFHSGGSDAGAADAAPRPRGVGFQFDSDEEEAEGQGKGGARPGSKEQDGPGNSEGRPRSVASSSKNSSGGQSFNRFHEVSRLWGLCTLCRCMCWGIAHGLPLPSLSPPSPLSLPSLFPLFLSLPSLHFLYWFSLDPHFSV